MSLSRTITHDIEDWYENGKKQALLIKGARQTGKTFIIREFGDKHFTSVAEINFIENKDAADILRKAANARDMIARISLLTQTELIPGKTLIFLDEIQKFPEITTAIKFLVDEGSYRYILSGSLLGVDLQSIESVPVGYMRRLTMYPMDFQEFLQALKVNQTIIDTLHHAYETRTPVEETLNQKILQLYHLYLMIGGMPAAVQTFLDTNNLRSTVDIQKSIILMYKDDIAKYDPDHKLYIEETFDLVPSELNNRNKRFILKNLNENYKFNKEENSFIWLKDAGVAIPVYCCDEPVSPLMLSKSSNLFKLFAADVGLLTAMYAGDTQLKILNGDLNINFGAIYENVVAQELTAHGFSPYYYNNKKRGEVDFVIEDDGEITPIEVKSGKNYNRHAALTNLLSVPDYHFKNPCVLAEANISVKNGILYLPVYMTMFMHVKTVPEDLVYVPDLSGLR